MFPKNILFLHGDFILSATTLWEQLAPDGKIGEEGPVRMGAFGEAIKREGEGRVDGCGAHVVPKEGRI